MAFQSRSKLGMCRATVTADQCLISGQMSFWVYEIENLKLPVTAAISAPLCAVQSCCGSAKMVTSLVTLLGHVGCLQLCLQLHWRGWCCSDFYSEMSSAAGKVHPMAVSIACVGGLLIYATSSSKINGLKNSFQ